MKDGERLDLPGDKLPANLSTAWRSQGRKVVVVNPAGHFHGEKSIAEELDTLPLPTADRKLILVIHSPPWNTGLDVLFDGTHVGSRAVRSFIEKYRPLLVLHGHIHESPEVSGIWIEHLGPTVCINPGHSPQRLHGVYFDLDDLPGEFEHLVTPASKSGSLLNGTSHQGGKPTRWGLGYNPKRRADRVETLPNIPPTCCGWAH
jgi:hypothetical protein